MNLDEEQWDPHNIQVSVTSDQEGTLYHLQTEGGFESLVNVVTTRLLCRRWT